MSIDETSATAVTARTPADETAVSPDLLADHAGFLRRRVGLLHADVAEVQSSIAELHRGTLEPAIESRTLDASKRPHSELLATLSALGFAWTTIASLCEVSVPALRKWRTGASEPTPANRQRLAQLVALAELLEGDHLIADVAGWLELQLDSKSPVTGLDLIKLGRPTMVVELAGGHVSPGQILDEIDDGWRERISRFEVVDGPDGDPVIRPIVGE